MFRGTVGKFAKGARMREADKAIAAARKEAAEAAGASGKGAAAKRTAAAKALQEALAKREIAMGKGAAGKTDEELLAALKPKPRAKKTVEPGK
jgi:hypothetical protein